jgi:hypothetical protein
MSSNKSTDSKKGPASRRQAGERPGNYDLSQVLIRLQVSPEEDRDSSSFKKINRAFTNNQTGEKRSYEVRMPIVKEFCKENAPKLFDAMHIATIEAHKTSGDGQNVYYQAAKLLTEAFMDTAAEREPEIREQVKGKLALRITKEKHEEELKEQEKSYHQSLLELAIEDPEIGNFVEEDLEVDKMSLEELTALFASGDFGFNFVDDDIPSADPSGNPGDTGEQLAPGRAEGDQVQGTTSTTTKKKVRTTEGGSSKAKKNDSEESSKKKKKEADRAPKKSREPSADERSERERDEGGDASMDAPGFKIPRRARSLVCDAIKQKKGLSDMKKSHPTLTGEDLEARLNDPNREWGRKFCKEYFEKLVQESVVNPNEAAEAQRNYMMHVMCKPFNMTIDQFVTRVKKMSSLLAYFPRNPDSEVQFNRPLTPIELNKVIFKGLPEKWRQQIETSNPNWAKKSETDFKEMLKNFEKHDLATRNSSNNSKNGKEKKNQSRKRQKDPEDTKAESYRTEGGQHCHLCAMFGASESRIKSHNTDQCKSAKYYKNQIDQGKQKMSGRNNDDKNSAKRRKTSREINAMEVDSSDDEKEQKNTHLFESFMNMMMKEFKKRKTEYNSDSS